jgi:hypothetical protein
MEREREKEKESLKLGTVGGVARVRKRERE